MAEKRVEVVVAAKNALGAGLRSAAADVQQFAANAKRSVSGDGKGGGSDLIGLASLAKGLAALQGVRLAFESIGVVTKLIRGDSQGVVDAIERMPAGLGEAARAVHALYDEWNGVAEENARMEAMQRDNAATAAKLKFMREYADATAEAVENSRLELAIINAASDADRARLRIAHDMLKADREFAAARSMGAGKADIAERAGAANELAKARLQKVAEVERDARTNAIKAAAEAAAQAEAEAAKAMDEAIRERRQELLQGLQDQKRDIEDARKAADTRITNQIAAAGGIRSDDIGRYSTGAVETAQARAMADGIAKGAQETKRTNSLLDEISNKIDMLQQAIKATPRTVL